MTSTQPEAPMFSTRWLNNNIVIGVIFAVLLVVNAYAIANGYYS